ncbi:MAG: hypothetical protein CVV42_13405 [Candidatus Riflebacteria bacterium HGW-Riflebacteria-2]|jgi:poly(ADP-ribose) glycohydrolase ARH3|nr:MAG: hypothetical protein CVV42_13405 [Candidatus Riflebacteria bacterium HGW-Riflebacteria-2]
MILPEDQYVGCLLGLALGDALGAPYEGGIIERLVWRFIGKTDDGSLRWTDDTQMSLDLAESLLTKGALYQDELARRFAESYSWKRGYGPGAARILKLVKRGYSWRDAVHSVYREGSFGNGAAMRAPVLALFFPDSIEKLIVNTRAASEVTHSHPVGIDGAILIAVATSQLLAQSNSNKVLEVVSANCQTAEIRAPLQVAVSWLQQKSLPTVSEVVTRLGNGITAHKSCVTALYIALRFIDNSFADMLNFVVACGGDVDTIGAMAGALWGSYNGHDGLPDIKIESRLLIENTSRRIYAAVALK